MSLTSAAVGVGLQTLLRRRARALSDERYWAQRSGEIQRSQLRWLLERAAGTAFGQRRHFAAVAGRSDRDIIRAFRDEVPILSYPGAKPWLDRMRVAGESNIAWPGFVRDWAQTSGTTAGEKFVPISNEMLAHNRRAALDVVAHAMRFGVSVAWVFRGKSLTMGGSSALVDGPSGTRWGDLSGITTRLVRWPISSAFLPSRKTSLIGDWPVKLDRMAREALDADVRWINGMPSWTLKLFEAMRDLAESRGRPFRSIREVWPNLKVFVHGGVRYDPFDRRTRQAWSGDAEGDDIPVRIEVYAASEAFIATQDRIRDPGLRLNIDHRVFYEFVPLESADADNPPAFDVSDVEPGQRYAIALSTCGGLWRFLLGDVVQFDSAPPDAPARLRIIGRVRHFMNAFGEHIIVDHIERAVVDAQRATGITVGEFTAAPVYPEEGRRPGIELAIEFANPRACAAADLSRFAEVFDRSIQGQNLDYTAKRRGDAGLAPPIVSPLPLGAFHRWMEASGKLGGQHKCPRCANSREIIDAVLALARADSAASGPSRPAAVIYSSSPERTQPSHS